MNSSHDDDELIEQLGRLGAAAESAVASTDADAIVDNAVSIDTSRSSIGPAPVRGRVRGLAAVAAALLLFVGAGAALLRSDDSSPSVATHVGQNTAFNDNGWEELRDCESSGHYDIDTGNTFYGAYQFTWQTWETVGGTGNPASAPPYEQDIRAAELYARRGTQPWPICGRFIRGPMANPLIAAWIAPWDQPRGVIVFFDPALSDEDLAESRAYVEALPWFDPTQTQFVDQASALAEFRSLLDVPLEGRYSVTEQDMPASLRLVMVRYPTRPKPNEAAVDPIAELERAEGVFQVLSGTPDPWTTTVSIPSLGVSTDAPTSWKLADLASDVVVVAPSGLQQPRAGRGSPTEELRVAAGLPSGGPWIVASTRPDWDLAALRRGDAVSIEKAITMRPGISSVVRVDVVVHDIAQSVHVDDLADATRLDLGPIALIAVDPADPLRRIVVGTEAIDE